MATPMPKNVAAVIGLVPTVIAGARRLPAKAVQLPVLALGTALSGLETARREYGELADRGEKLIAQLRGTSIDALANTVDSVLGTSTVNAKEAVQAGEELARDRTEANKAVQQTLPVAEPTPTPTAARTAARTAAPTAAPARVDSAAAPEVIEQVEKIAGNVDAPLITDHDELPLPDYDHMTLGTLRGRLRSLDMQQLVQLRDYEKSKADRLPVITLLDNRIAKLANGESTPTGAADSSPTPVNADTKPPKKVSATAAAQNNAAPPHTKVRIT
jgi:hypothetical protein